MGCRVGFDNFHTLCIIDRIQKIFIYLDWIDIHWVQIKLSFPVQNTAGYLLLSLITLAIFLMF